MEGNNLSMVVSLYDTSSVHCSYPAAFSKDDNCEYLAQVMPISATFRNFVGDRGQSTPKAPLDVPLPYTLHFPGNDQSLPQTEDKTETKG